LLRDFGANPFRKRGVFAPLKELIEPYQSSDYRDIVSREWQVLEGKRRSAAENPTSSL